MINFNNLILNIIMLFYLSFDILVSTIVFYLPHIIFIILFQLLYFAYIFLIKC